MTMESLWKLDQMETGWMNNSWYSKDYNKIGNHGGNRNSIGIESTMNSDLTYT